MKKSNLSPKLCFSLFTLLVISAPAFADNHYRGGMIRCETSSNGEYFADESRDPILAKRQAISQCVASNRTNNDECRANAICDDEHNTPMISCSTTSNGLEFIDESRDSALARSQAIAQCVQNNRTNNDECRANSICSDEVVRPMISCSTTSNGLEFIDESRNSALARSQVIAQCVQNNRTNNDECRANSICSDEVVRPMISCSTSSNGLEFLDESRDPELARSQVITQCIQNNRTNNDECRANIYCNDNSSSRYPREPRRPQPQPQPQPQPRIETCTANRYDPAGMFVQSYRASGYNGEACQLALRDCNYEIRGRQYCSISR